MKASVQININASAAAVWNVITDIKNCMDVISGIEAIEIHNMPESGLVGLKWKETRTMFGKTATEVMWITDSVENERYSVRAESHGSVYLTDLRLESEDSRVLLTYEFRSEPRTGGAKFMDILFGRMMRKATAKGLMNDLEDIKKAVEAGF